MERATIRGRIDTSTDPYSVRLAVSAAPGSGGRMRQRGSFSFDLPELSSDDIEEWLNTDLPDNELVEES